MQFKPRAAPRKRPESPACPRGRAGGWSAFLAGFAAVLPCGATHAQDAAAGLRLPRVFSDHMVLQRQSEVRVWGWSGPGARVDVTGSWGAGASAVADDRGEWSLVLRTGPASAGPETVLVESGPEAVRLTDVAIGEVWLAAGQSNMQMPLAQSSGGDAAAKDADNPLIRMLRIAPRGSLEPERDLASGWAVSSAANAAGFSAVAFHFAERLQEFLNVPVGIIGAAWGGSTTDAWIDEGTLSGLGFVALPESIDVPIIQRLPATAFNGMISPIAGYAIKGVIWYQGEAQVETAAAEYERLLTELVRSWRALWKDGAMPFYYAQIAGFDYGRMGRSNLGAAAVRLTQAGFAERTPRTGMVVTLDVSDCEDIHPRAKATVGQRLANWALAEAYGTPQGAYRSARVERVERAGAGLRIVFGGSGGPMTGTLQSFEVAGGAADEFVPAVARFEGDHSVLVSSSEVSLPARVRYAAGGDCPVATVFGGDGLPVGPFSLPAPYVRPSLHWIPDR